MVEWMGDTAGSSVPELALFRHSFSIEPLLQEPLHISPPSKNSHDADRFCRGLIHDHIGVKCEESYGSGC